MKTPAFPAASGTATIRPLPVNELIAAGALLALAAWAVIIWSGHGGEPVTLGPLDPAQWIPGRSLTRADVPLVLMLVAGGVPLVWGLDSASLVQPEDSDRILMIGSHGGLLGGDPASALRGAARAAVFNDAGVGIDGAGLTRLPALDARGMPAATVDCWSARIGDARSMWQTGTLSHVNAAARALGAAPGISACAFADLINGAR